MLFHLDLVELILPKIDCGFLRFKIQPLLTQPSLFHLCRFSDLHLWLKRSKYAESFLQKVIWQKKIGSNAETQKKVGRNAETGSTVRRLHLLIFTNFASNTQVIICIRVIWYKYKLGVERSRNQVFVAERDILFPYFKFRFRLSRYRISGRKKAGKFVILWIYFRESLSLSE